MGGEGSGWMSQQNMELSHRGLLLPNDKKYALTDIFFYIISQVVVITSHAAALARAPCVKKMLK